MSKRKAEFLRTKVRTFDELLGMLAPPIIYIDMSKTGALDKPILSVRMPVYPRVGEFVSFDESDRMITGTVTTIQHTHHHSGYYTIVVGLKDVTTRLKAETDNEDIDDDGTVGDVVDELAGANLVKDNR